MKYIKLKFEFIPFNKNKCFEKIIDNKYELELTKKSPKSTNESSKNRSKEEITMRLYHSDGYGDHSHTFNGCIENCVITNKGHIHYIEGESSVDKGHKHTFRMYTLIEETLGHEKINENVN